MPSISPINIKLLHYYFLINLLWLSFIGCEETHIVPPAGFVHAELSTYLELDEEQVRQTGLIAPHSLAKLPDGRLLIGDAESRSIILFDLQLGLVSTYASGLHIPDAVYLPMSGQPNYFARDLYTHNDEVWVWDSDWGIRKIDSLTGEVSLIGLPGGQLPEVGIAVDGSDLTDISGFALMTNDDIPTLVIALPHRLLEGKPGSHWVLKGGSQIGGDWGDFRPATQGAFYFREHNHLVSDGTGGLYIMDWWNGKIRYIDSEGILYSLAGGGLRRTTEAEDGKNLYLELLPSDTMGLGVQPGVLYFTEQGFLRKITVLTLDAQNRTVETLVEVSSPARDFDLSAITETEDSLFVTARLESALLKLNDEDFEVLTTDDDERLTAGPLHGAVAYGTNYILGVDPLLGQLISIETNTGEIQIIEKQKYASLGPFTSVAVSPDGLIYYTNRRFLYGLDPINLRKATLAGRVNSADKPVEGPLVENAIGYLVTGLYVLSDGDLLLISNSLGRMLQIDAGDDQRIDGSDEVILLAEDPAFHHFPTPIGVSEDELLAYFGGPDGIYEIQLGHSNTPRRILGKGINIPGFGFPEDEIRTGLVSGLVVLPDGNILFRQYNSLALWIRSDTVYGVATSGYPQISNLARREDLLSGSLVTGQNLSILPDNNVILTSPNENKIFKLIIK